jgi:hypothetical protein
VIRRKKRRIQLSRIVARDDAATRIYSLLIWVKYVGNAGGADGIVKEDAHN